MPGPELSRDQSREAFRRIMAWRTEPAKPIACPACEVPGLAILDRSARPYSEWYELSCPACGLDTTLHIPLAPPRMD